MRLPEFVPIYLLGNDVSARTADDYRWVAHYFDRDVGIGFDELTSVRMNEYLVALKARGWKASSVHSFRTKLLVLWKAAYREGYTENRPDTDRIRRVKVPPPNPQGFSEEETRLLVAWCEVNLRRRMRLISVPAGDYLAALFAFLWDSGMRIGDAISMEFAWLGPRVTWCQSKTSVWHQAEISPRTLELIERIRIPERAMIWPRPAKSRTALYRLIRRAAAGAGLNGTSKFFRRGGATNVHVNGGDAGRYCGHVAGSRVAYRFYVSPAAQLKSESPNRL